MTNTDVLRQAERFAEEAMGEEGTGHDWLHVQRVYRTARLIQSKEGGDRQTVGLAALFHDIADRKIHVDVEPRLAIVREAMTAWGVPRSQFVQVMFIIENLSWSKEVVLLSLEGQIVQDADRIDALGPVGVARCFAFGGARGRPIVGGHGSSVGHFEEKLLRLAPGMNTRTGRAIAEPLHDYLLDFLDKFATQCAVGDDAVEGLMVT